MSEGEKTRLQKEWETLKQMRDELRVQAHLFRADAKDLWKEMDGKMKELEKDMRGARNIASETGQGVGKAAEQMVKEVREGFTKLRKLL